MSCFKKNKVVIGKKDSKNKKKSNKLKLPECLVNSTSEYGVHYFKITGDTATKISNISESIFDDSTIHLIVNAYNGEMSKNDIKDIYVAKGDNVDDESERIALVFAKEIGKEKKPKKFTCTITVCTKQSEPEKLKLILKNDGKNIQDDNKNDDRNKFEEDVEHQKSNPDENLNGDILKENPTEKSEAKNETSSSSSTENIKKNKKKNKSSDNLEEIDFNILKNCKDNLGLCGWVISKEIIQKPKVKLNDFYTKEVYIYLNSKKVMDETFHDLFIWNGMDSDPSDLKLAFKCVEWISKQLNNIDVIMKEGYYFQSDKLKTLNNMMIIHKFGKTTSKFYDESSKIIHVSGNKKFILAREKSFNVEYLSSDDCYIIEDKNKLYQFNGKDSNKDERFCCGMFTQHLKDYKKNAVIAVIDEENGSDYEILKKIPIAPKNEKHEMKYLPKIKKIKIISNSSIKEKIDKLDSKECYLINLETIIFLWIGMDSSKENTNKGIKKFYKILSKNENVHLIGQILFNGNETQEFENCKPDFMNSS